MTTGTAYQRGGVWWIRYRLRGKQVREPGGLDGKGARTKTEALERLRQRIGEISSERYIGPSAERVTVSDLLDSYEASLTAKEAKGAAQAASHLLPIRARFGELRAIDVTTDAIREYAAGMRGRTNRSGRLYGAATINRGLQAFRAAFNLARKEDRLARVPYFPLLKENNVRKGFFEPADFEAVAESLPEPENGVARFGYLTGWRLGEILPLRWEDVDLGSGFVFLRDSKNGEPRTVPFDRELRDLMERRWEARAYTRADGTAAVSAFVFHLDGCRLWRLRHWARACKDEGMPGRLFHDLRRTAVRDMIRAGVPQAVAMARTGHKTDAVFRRYNIASGADLLDAAERTAAYRAQRIASRNVTPMRKRDSVSTN